MVEADERPEPPEISTEMALAIYAATAATSALRSMHAAKLVNDDLLRSMAQHLLMCRDLTNRTPQVEEHIEKLADMLLGGLTPQ